MISSESIEEFTMPTARVSKTPIKTSAAKKRSSKVSEPASCGATMRPVQYKVPDAAATSSTEIAAHAASVARMSACEPTARLALSASACRGFTSSKITSGIASAQRETVRAVNSARPMASSATIPAAVQNCGGRRAR